MTVMLVMMLVLERHPAPRLGSGAATRYSVARRIDGT
jgi:hypothetical protein